MSSKPPSRQKVSCPNKQHGCKATGESTYIYNTHLKTCKHKPGRANFFFGVPSGGPPSKKLKMSEEEGAESSSAASAASGTHTPSCSSRTAAVDGEQACANASGQSLPEHPAHASASTPTSRAASASAPGTSRTAEPPSLSPFSGAATPAGGSSAEAPKLSARPTVRSMALGGTPSGPSVAPRLARRQTSFGDDGEGEQDGAAFSALEAAMSAGSEPMLATLVSVLRSLPADVARAAAAAVREHDERSAAEKRLFAETARLEGQLSLCHANEDFARIDGIVFDGQYIKCRVCSLHSMSKDVPLALRRGGSRAIGVWRKADPPQRPVHRIRQICAAWIRPGGWGPGQCASGTGYVPSFETDM
jgi:hypothetical protein